MQVVQSGGRVLLEVCGSHCHGTPTLYPHTCSSNPALVLCPPNI